MPFGQEPSLICTIHLTAHRSRHILVSSAPHVGYDVARLHSALPCEAQNTQGEATGPLDVTSHDNPIGTPALWADASLLGDYHGRHRLLRAAL
jgi:hypothetical protein